MLADGYGWIELYKVYQLANTLIYKGRMNDILDNVEDRWDIRVHTSPPFSIFIDILVFYQSFRRVEMILSRTYPIAADPSKFFSTELDVRRKDYLG